MAAARRSSRGAGALIACVAAVDPAGVGLRACLGQRLGVGRLYISDERMHFLRHGWSVEILYEYVTPFYLVPLALPPAAAPS